MGCQQIATCQSQSSGFLAQARIGTVAQAGVYTFGNFPAGIYQVSYAAGAVFNIVFGWSALTTDTQHLVVIACDGSLHIDFGGAGVAPTQAGAEASASGKSICFEHSGGSIGMEFSSAIYSENVNGSPNPTFNLLSMVPVQAVDTSNNSDNSGSGAGKGRPVLGCAEKVDCGDGQSDAPIQNFSSEAPDIPSSPFFPVIPAQPPTLSPPTDEPPPVPPPLNNVTWNCGVSPDGLKQLCTAVTDGTGAFLTLDDCNKNCFGGGGGNPNPPPEPPPPTPPLATYNCVDGVCIDPGDGSGAYGDAQTCAVACSGSSCGVITPSGVLLGSILPPLDCGCSKPVDFTMSGGSFRKPIQGELYALFFPESDIGAGLVWDSTSTLTMTSDVVCILASQILTIIGAGTYTGCIILETPFAGPQPCCAVTFQVSSCACGNINTYNICQPNYPIPNGNGCPASCDSCCNALESLGVGDVSFWSDIALTGCLGVDPTKCFKIGSKRFCPSFVSSTPPGASYRGMSFYDVTRVA